MTRLLLLICLAASAGVHAALAAEHGPSFYLAAALLAFAAAAVALVPGRAAAVGSGVLLAGLLGAYALEHGAAFGDGVAAVTKAVEAAGLLLAARLAVARASSPPQRVMTLVAAGMIAVFAAAATPYAAHDHPPGTGAHGH